MHRKQFMICSFLGIFLLFSTSMHLQAQGTFRISDYKIDVNVDRSAVFTVVETIQIEQCEDLEFTKDILQDYSYDTDQNGSKESYPYGISNIKVENATYDGSKVEGKQRLKIHLESASQQVVLSYQVRMRDIPQEENDIFLYHFFEPSLGATIDKLQIQLHMPVRLDTQMDVYSIDQNGNRMDNFHYQMQDNTLTIHNTEPISEGRGLLASATLRNFYFTYSNPFSLHLWFTIFSILFVIASYAFIFYYPRKRKKKVWKECYPIEQVRMGTLGYIMDGVCDEKDIISIIIAWANHNYIQIRDENQTISLCILNELPNNAPPYELHLFNIIFTNYMMVTIDQLKARYLHDKMLEVVNEIYQALASQEKNAIFTSTSFKFQCLSLLFVVIPLSLTMYACTYLESYNVILSLFAALCTSGAVAFNCLPWIWILKHRYQLAKNKLDVYRLLIGIINFICGAILYTYMLQHLVPPVYAVISVIACILEVCIMLFMDKRTFYGRTLRLRLLSLYQFMRLAKTSQIEDKLYDNEFYFEDMLPYAYIFDTVEIWGKKFTAISLQAPTWYYHANASANSSIYWMSALEKSLRFIQDALMSENPAVLMAKKGKVEKVKNVKKPKSQKK